MVPVLWAWMRLWHAFRSTERREPVPGERRRRSSVPGSSKRWWRRGRRPSGGLAAEVRQRLAVEVEDDGVVAADDEQGRCAHCGQAWHRPGPGRPPRDTTAATSLRRFGGGPQRGRRAGAGAEVADRQPRRRGLRAHPRGHVDQPPGQQVDVEHVGPIGCSSAGVSRSKRSVASPAVFRTRGDVAVARAVAAATAAVCEHDDAHALGGNGEAAGQPAPPASIVDPVVADVGDQDRSITSSSAGLAEVRVELPDPPPATAACPPRPARRRAGHPLGPVGGRDRARRARPGAAPCGLGDLHAARAVDPVAMPSSTTTTVRPARRHRGTAGGSARPAAPARPAPAARPRPGRQVRPGPGRAPRR